MARLTGALSPDFSISVRVDGSTATVDVRGELGLSTAPKLARALEELPAAAVDIRLDLREVWFADASALSRLQRSRRRLVQQGRTLRVTQLSSAVVHVLDATGLGADFELTSE